MRVSIVTISLNQAKFLEAAIDSVLQQDYDEIEYIVVDGGSRDGSRHILEQCAARLHFWCSEADSGPASGLNKGFGKATGDLFGYINADDYLLPGAVSTAVRAFKRRPDADVVFGHGWLADKCGRRIRRVFSDRWDLCRYAAGACTVVQQATFFRSDAFARVGGFNEANRLTWDGELLVDMSLAGCRMVRIHRCLGAFRLHDASITGSGQHGSEAHHQEMKGLSRKIWDRRDCRFRRSHSVGMVEKRFADPLISFAKAGEAISSIVRTGRLHSGAMVD